MAVSAYLSLSHYRNYTDIGYQSFCAISRSLNCDTVSQDPSAIFLNVPVAFWGCLGYAFFLTSLMLFRTKRNIISGWAILCLAAGFFSLISIFLALVSSFYVHSYCLMCIVIYGINFMLLLLTWMAQQRFGFGSFISTLKLDVAHLNEKRGKAFLVVFSFIVLSLTTTFFYPKYWVLPTFPENQEIEHGVTDEGNPWIGAQNPVLTIVEFSDYMCFQCGKMHSHLRRLVSQYPGKIRLVHRHYPLDHLSNPFVKEPVHNQSGMVSLLAIYAQEQDKFWQVNDILFREAREKKLISFSVVAKETGLDFSDFQEMINDRLIIRLAGDIRDGAKLGISATPSFVIEGKLYTGIIPEKVLAPIIEAN